MVIDESRTPRIVMDLDSVVGVLRLLPLFSTTPLMERASAQQIGRRLHVINFPCPTNHRIRRMLGTSRSR